MGGDKFDQLYNALKADGAVSGTRENFKKFVYAPGKQGYQNRLQLYNALHADGAVSSKSYEEFAQKIGLHAVNNTKQPTAQPRSKAAQQAVAYKAPQVSENFGTLDTTTAGQSWLQRQNSESKPVNRINVAKDTPVDVTSRVTGKQGKAPRVVKHNKNEFFTQTQLGDSDLALDYGFEGRTQKVEDDKKRAAALLLDQLTKSDFDGIDKLYAQKSGKLFEKSMISGITTDPNDAMGTMLGSMREASQKYGTDAIIAAYNKAIPSILNSDSSRKAILEQSKKLGMDPDVFIQQYMLPGIEKTIHDRLVKQHMPKSDMDYVMRGVLNGVGGNLITRGVMTKTGRDIMNEGHEKYLSNLEERIKDDGVFSKAGAAKYGNIGVGMLADTAAFSGAGKIAGGMMSGLGTGVTLLTDTPLGKRLLGGVVTSTSKLAEKYGIEGAARIANFAGNNKTWLGMLLTDGTKSTLRSGLTLGNYEAMHYITGEGYDKVESGDTRNLFGGFLNAYSSGFKSGLIFGGVGAVGSTIGRNVGITGAETSNLQRIKNGIKKASVSTGAFVAESLAFRSDQIAEEWAKDHKINFMDNFIQGACENMAMKLGSGHYKQFSPKNILRSMTMATGDKSLKLTDTEKRIFLENTDARNLVEACEALEPSHKTQGEGLASENTSGMKYEDRVKVVNKKQRDLSARDAQGNAVGKLQQFLDNKEIPLKLRMKVSAALGGTMGTKIPRASRIVIEQGPNGKNTVKEYAEDGELIDAKEHSTYGGAEEDRQERYLRRQDRDFKDEYLNAMDVTTQEDKMAVMELVAKDNGFGSIEEMIHESALRNSQGDDSLDKKIKADYKKRGEEYAGTKAKRVLDIQRAVSEEYGVDLDKAMDKDFLLRTDKENEAIDEFKSRLRGMNTDKNDEAQNKAVARQDGADLSEQTELEDSEKFTESAKTVNDRQTSATAAWMEMVKNTPELEEWMKNNPDATVEEMRDNFGDDVADAYMELSKAKSMKDGFIQNTSQKIEDAVQNQVAQARFTGTMQNKQGAKVATDNTVTIFSDKDGNEYTLVGGDVIVDTAGDGSYSVGKSGLVIFRDKDGNTVQRTNFDGLTEVGTLSAEDYANRVRTTLQERKTAEIQSSETPLPEVQKEEPKGEKKSDEPNGEGESSHEEEGGPYKAGDVKGVSTSNSSDRHLAEHPNGVPDLLPTQENDTPSDGKGTTKSADSQENNETLTFKDGTEVPMTEDSKGRPTADYGEMTPAHAAEYISTTFGDNADKVVDGKIKRAEAAVKAANKIKVDYSADDADILEAEGKKKAAVEAAEKDLTFYTKVKAEMNKKAAYDNAGGGGQTGNRYEQWRKDGYHIGEGGVRYDRQKEEDQTGVYGREATVDFAPGVSVKGRFKAVEVGSVQASHKNGQVNPLHFGLDWQPKDRTDEASTVAQDKALKTFDPLKITGDGNAFIFSSPSLNKRYETIQGNNRIEILRRLYAEYPEKAALYKQWLIDHAAEFGLDAAEISKMDKPILVIELPVDDAKAKELGQYKASDFESSGKEIPQTGAVVNKLGDKMETVASILMRQGELGEDAKLSDLINQNADKVLDFLSMNGIISETEVQTLRKDRTQLRIWLGDLLKQGLFDGDKQTEAAFSQIPDNAKKAVLATYLRDVKSPEGAKIKANLQRSFDAYARLMGIPAFANAKNLNEARAAVNAEIEKGNTSLFGEAPLREEFSTFELELAAMYKGLKDQKTLAGLFNKYFDAVQGDKATNRQLELGEEPREAISKEDAIKEVFGSYDTKPAETQEQVDKAKKEIATELTKQLGEDLVTTDEKTGQEVIDNAEADGTTLKYSKREKPAPKKTQKVYKLMRLGDDGKLYPLFIDATAPTELGVWYDADSPDLSMLKDLPSGVHLVNPKTKKTMTYEQFYNEHPELFKGKMSKYPSKEAIKWATQNGMRFMYIEDTKKAQKRFEGEHRKYWNLGVNGSGTVSTFSMRPGWHAGSLPTMRQIGKGENKDLRDDRFVWVEGEVSADKDYSSEAESNPDHDLPDRIPEDGYYMKATNADKTKSQADRVGWYVAGSFKANRIIGDKEAHKVIDDWNVAHPDKKVEYDYERESGKEFNADTMQLEGEGKDRKEFRTKDGEVYGFVKDGKIYLDTKKMKPETPLHEYTHLWTEALKSKNPKEWENVKKLLDEVDGLKEEVQKLYPELKGDDLYDEMLATYSGREGTKKLEAEARRLAAEEGKTVTESAKAQGFVEKVKTALQKYWKGVADMLHIHFTNAEEVADKVLADWAKGVKPGEEKGVVKLEDPSNAEEGLRANAEAYKKEEAKGEQPPTDTGTKKWEDMTPEEKGKEADEHPLTEEEIRNGASEENQELVAAAIAYVNGDKSLLNQIAYLKIYGDVRNRHENVPGNSGTEDGTQLAATDNGSGDGLELESGRGSGGAAEPVDKGAGGETASGEPESGENGEGGANPPAGKQGDSQGEGGTPGLGGLSAGSTKPEGSGTTGGKGSVGRGGRRGGSGGPSKSDAKRKPTAKQGTIFPDSKGKDVKKETSDAKAAMKAAFAKFKELNKKDKGKLSSSLLFGLENKIPTAEALEYLPEVMKATGRYGIAVMREGIYKAKEWFDSVREAISDDMKDCGFSDEDVDAFIREMWHMPWTMDGETHKIGEWSSIYGYSTLRSKLKEPLKKKFDAQVLAEPTEVKVGDKKNIEETLPFLLPQQQDDVLRAETQFFDESHKDKAHAGGKGYMFTNGTGTGKTYTGLGIVKRMVKQGKKRILIITPSQAKVTDWKNDGKNLCLDIRDLDEWAKERGTTATTEKGEGVVITTFANFRANKSLLEDQFDMVVYDESHRIMENKKGIDTEGSRQHYMLTNRNEDYALMRLEETNEDWQKLKGLAEDFDNARKKKINEIEEQYRKENPSATDRDVRNATQKLYPKDMNSFSVAEKQKFPELGKIYDDYIAAISHYETDVKPGLVEQAKKSVDATKVVFLSATPFNSRENIEYAEGYLFSYPERNAMGQSGKTQFFLEHFGAGYKYRYHRLENSVSNAEALAKQEVEFSDWLQNDLGTMSGRVIDSPYDYSRDFPTVSVEQAQAFNEACEEISRDKLGAVLYQNVLGDYNYGNALFETMKVGALLPRLKAHLDAGRKVVIFHRRVASKQPLKPPFEMMLGEVANRVIKAMPENERAEATKKVQEWRQKYAGLLAWEQTLDYSMPREQLAKAFGKDNVLFFSGNESSKEKNAAIKEFNSDDSGKNIIVIQEASGKEGISLHDTTGKHQRVCITLALPQSPITALQIEGRTYRIGNESNAIFEYPVLGLNSEYNLFASKFNQQVSTTENLALGSQARNLRESFARGIEEHSGYVPLDQQGVGGKDFDRGEMEERDPFDNAVLDYYTNQKINRNNREGVNYFPTPEPLGYKMVEWANIGEGDSVLEPSAGHGAIARYVPKSNELVAIEPSMSLFAKLQMKAGGMGRKFQNGTFEDYFVGNKHDTIVMNPPFGHAGATAIEHLSKAFGHLEEGGRIVAIIPRGATDKKFDKWLGTVSKAVLRAEVNLPDIAFQQAGTKVNCRVVVLDRISDPALREKAGYPEKVDLSGHYDKIEDFFNDLRDVEMPDRIIDTNFKMQKLSKSLARNLKDVKGVRSVDIDKSGVRVDLSRDWRDYSISFSGSDNPQRWREKMGETYDKYSQMEKTELNGDKQAVFGELKELACKLAGMTEDEMRRYLTSKNSNSYDEGGVRFRKDEDKESSQNLYLSLQNKKGKDYYDTVTEIANRVARGEARFAELPEEYESRGVLSIPQAGARAIVSAWVRDNKRRGKSIWSSDGMLGASLTQLGKDGQETCLAKIEEWSRDNGYWISEDSYISKGYKSDHGDEARVYFVGDKVIKFVDSRRLHYKEGIIGYLDRITLLNAVTPDATSRIIGFSRDKDGKFRVVLEQKKFAKTYEYELDANGDETENGARQYNDWITNDAPKIKRQLARRGIKYDIDGAEATYKGEVLLTDLWIANIACDEKGRYHIIDANAKLIKQNENTSDAPILVDNVGRENTDAQGETRFRKDESEDATSGELTPREREQQEQMEKHRATVLKATEKLNTRTTIHDNVEDIENETVRKAIENGEKVKAWYDVKTGEVHLYLPNVTDKYDAQKSVVHEVVGHNGMRNLLGESGYRDMMRRMYTHLSEEEASEVNERMMKNGWDFYTAMDEWVADKAEESVWTPQEYPKYIGLSNLWSHIKHYVTEAIHKAGYNINPNVDDVKYWLWESKRALQNGDTYTEMKRNSFLWRLNHGTGKETLDDVINSPAYNHGDAQENVRYRKETSDDAMIEEAKTLFRKGSLDYSKNDTPQETATKDAIERRLGSWQYRETEAWKDNMASLDTTQTEMSKSIKNFDSSMDVYHGAINQSSVVAEKRANFERRELKDLQQALRKPTKALGGGERGYENVNMYVYMKSGLERNRVLLVRDVANNIDMRIKKFNAELRESDPKANVITFTGIEQYRDEFHAEKDYLTTLLEQGQIDLHQYYDKLDKFIRDFEFTKTGDKAVDAKIDKLNKWYKDSVADKYDPNGNDYSGISSIVQYRVNGQFSDSAIIDAVMQAENTIGIDDVENLWSAVRGVTGYALESDHKYGIVSSAAKDRAKGMFNWYIPMRGFKEDSMEDSYAYMHSDSNKLASSSLKTAKGRTTLAQSPLGTAAAMAERAISRGEDNANKQRMYRLANAWLKEHTEEDGNGGMRLTEVPPVMVSDVWYEKKYDSLGNEYWEVATPDIKPDMSAEAIRKEITDFENDMKAKQAKGGATKTLQKGGYAKPFEDPMHKKQNIVTVWFGGKQRQIIFTGNPRAAQALNGELKSDEHGNRLMRFMGSMFTSYNVTFSVSNLSRDTLFANNNISIKENAEYYARFTAMQARLLGGQTIGMLTANVHEKVRGEYFNMWAHYKQGKAPKGDLEKLFYEFMDNGGKTGFVKTKTIDNFEDEIRKNAGGRKAMETVGKVLHSLPEVIEGLNERAENLNRFACYATSRKMGRSIMRSITDAKEVSVNFNRRGLGAKAFDVPGATWIEKVFVANAARWCRGSYMFFNAGMQGLRTLQKNMTKHPIKTTISTIGIPMVLGGYLIPLLNQVLAGDDGEKYASLPEWDRRNNFCFYLGKDKWLKIPLAIELRAFYGLGDVARSVEDKRLQSVNGVTRDAIAQLTQILPVDFMGEGMSPVNAAVPDVAKPMWQVANNEDWTGKPIYKDYDYMKYDPEYLKVYAGEFEPFVNLSKFINKASGGTAVTKGDWDGKWNNPAIWNNIVQGYFGGAGSDATRTAKIIKRLVTGDWDGFSTREVPMVRAMYSTPTEKTVYYRGLSKYAKYKELSDKYDHDMRVWKKNQDNPEISMKYNAELHGNSLDKRINALIKENEKVFKKCRKIINSGELSDDEAKAMQMQMDKAKLDLVNEIDNMK